MRIIRPRLPDVARYATLNRPHYICPECRIHIVRDREEDMFLCLKCGRKETRWEFRNTLIRNVADYQAEVTRQQEERAERDRIDRAMRRRENKELLSVVYYIQFGNLIKIGMSTNLSSRLDTIPWDKVLLTEPGGYELEGQRHKQFSHLNHSLEWFTEDAELTDFIDARREDLAAENSERYGDLPNFPWKRGEVKIPWNFTVARNLKHRIKFTDKIEIEELSNADYGAYFDANDFPQL